MAAGRASPEYRTMLAHTNDLRLAVRCDLLSLGGQLLAEGLISPDSEDSLRNMMQTEAKRAADCVNLITTKVEEDPQYFHTFFRVLQADSFQYKSILSKLQQTYTKYRQQLRQQPQPRAQPQPVAPPVQPPTTTAVHQPSGAPPVQRTGSDPSNAAYVTHSSPPVRFNSAPENSGFTISMSKEAFLSYMKQEGLSIKDCDILKENGITATIFAKDLSEADITQLGFTYGGKKVLKRLLKEISTSADSAESDALEFNENDKVEVSMDGDDGGKILIDVFKPYKTKRALKFTFGVVTPKLGQKVSSIDEYDMKKIPHGIALIINNESFAGRHSKREGTKLDERNLVHIFRHLRYQVEVHREVYAKTMLTIMEDMANRDHTKYDSFVCCILSHGKEGHIFGVDGEEVAIEKFTTKLSSCRSLKDKPKLFFLQACRGDLTEYSTIQPDGLGPEKNEAQPQKIEPTTDFFFGHATPHGCRAWRDKNDGSWYISELCRTLCEMSSFASLNDIMTTVCGRVGDKYDFLGVKMTPESTARLQKNVFF